MNSMCNFTLIVFVLFCFFLCYVYFISFSLVVVAVICDACDAILMDDNVPSATPPSYCVLLVLLIQLVQLMLMLALLHSDAFHFISFHFIALHSYQIYSISECTFCAMCMGGWLVSFVCLHSTFTSCTHTSSCSSLFFLVLLNQHIPCMHFECITVVYLDHCHSFSDRNVSINQPAVKLCQCLYTAISHVLFSFSLSPTAFFRLVGFYSHSLSKTYNCHFSRMHRRMMTSANKTTANILSKRKK